MSEKTKFGKCPRCDTTCDMTWPAISRRDNKTGICSGCGGSEALFDMKMHRKKQLLKNEYNNDIKMQQEIDSQIVSECHWLIKVQE